MQRIKLFSQYDIGALMTNTTRELRDQVNKWPEEYLHANEVDQHIIDLRDSSWLQFPEIDFLNGRETIVDRILQLSDFQPGMRPGVKVRISVLVYKYPVKGAAYLLGCCPTKPAADVPGEWFTDTANQEVFVEYTQYAKHPRKTILAHQASVAALHQTHQNLRSEIDQFNNTLHYLVNEAVQKRIEDEERIRIMRTMLGQIS